MNCPNCQRPVNPNEKFCRSCGCMLIQPEAEVQQAAPQAEETETPRTWENEVPQTSQTWENEEPQTSQTWENEAPQTSQTWENEEPQTSQTWENEAPQTSQTWENEISQMPETSQPDAQPPKKKSKLPMIIIICAVAAVLIGAGIFCAFYFFGNNKSGQNTGDASSSQSDTVPTEVPVEKTLSELVEKYSQAVNSGDTEALEKLFLPEKKEVLLKGTEALTAVNELVKQAGQELEYKIVLLDGVTVSGDAADGKIKITAALPIVGEQSTESDIEFRKLDGTWYISNL